MLKNRFALVRGIAFLCRVLTNIRVKSYNVYLHKHPKTGEIFYVGKGLPGRERSKRNRNPYWINYVNKAGGFEVEIHSSDLTADSALQVEADLIQLYGRKMFEGGTLVNLTTGGEGRTGFGLPGEKNPMFGVSRKGHKVGRNVKGDANPMFGRKQSDSTKEAIRQKAIDRNYSGERNPMFGVKRPEVGERVRLTQSKAVRMISENAVRVFSSLSDAARENNYSLSCISSCARGRLKSYKGFKWEFVV